MAGVHDGDPRDRVEIFVPVNVLNAHTFSVVDNDVLLTVHCGHQVLVSGTSRLVTSEVTHVVL
jgi:hypothetical protein